MKEIQLTQGYVALVDDDDYERVKWIKWTLRTTGRNNIKKYALTTIFIAATRKTLYLRLHHFILNHNPNGLEIDHIDGDGLNNQKSNLRLCTRQQNCQNVKSQKNRKFKGVSKAKGVDKYRSYIKCNKKFHSLGIFNSELEAAKAYNNKAIELFGEYACLNIV